MSARSATSLRIPYIIARDDEVAPQPLRFVRRMFGGYKLAYDEPRRGDVLRGVLRVRVRHSGHGAPLWRRVNTVRQWRCMERLWCQVCGKPARDPATKRIPWIMTETAFRDLPGESASGLTNAPPTCVACIPEALDTCPQLHISSTVCTVASAEPVAVLADMFTRGLGNRPIPTGEHNVEIRLDDQVLIPTALATQLVVQVHDLRPAPHLAA